MEEVLAEARSPRDVCRAVSRNVAYRVEDKDRWASLEETWRRGFGDCEDFASAVALLCHRRGWEAKVYLFFSAGGTREGHAVVVGTWQGRLWMSDVGSYREVQSMQDVRERVAYEMECDADDLWNAVLDYASVQRFIERGRETTRPTGQARR